MNNKLVYGNRSTYRWTRYSTVVCTSAVVCTATTSATLQYSNTVTISQGNVVLIDPISVTVSYSNYNSASIYNLIKGKYWKAGGYNYVYYCPANATITTSYNLFNQQCTWNATGNKVFEGTESITNEDDIYPHNGVDENVTGYYVYLGGPDAILDSDLYGGVNYECNINTDTDLQVGNTAASKITYVTSNVNANTIGTVLTYQVKQNGDSSYRNVGKYIVTNVDKNTNGKYAITAYDNISKFDINVDEWLESVTFPITVGNLLSSLCTYCGVTANSTTFTNSTFQIQDNFNATNLTGRQMLIWIAEIAASFIVALPNGNIAVKQYASTQTTLDNSKYKSLFASDNTAAVIDKVWVGQDVEDIGVTYGTGNEVLKILGNPLLRFEEASEITTQVQNIYNVVHAYTYTPMSIELFNDQQLNVGDIVSVNSVNTFIFNKTWSNAGVKLESTGGVHRLSEINSYDTQISAIRGKVHDLTVDVTGISSHVQDLDVDVDGLHTSMDKTLTWNATTGLIIFNNTTGNEISIDGDQITANTINANEINMTGRIAWSDLNHTSVDPHITGNVYRQATVPTGTTEVPLVVGAFWYCTANVSTYEADNWYTYDGTNWNLTSNPYYITSTYIDSTTIKSPSIEGNSITVNADAGGSFNLQKNGSSLGFMGVGSAYDTEGTLSEGIVVGNNDNGQGTYLEEGDNFLSVTPIEVKLQFGKETSGVINYKSIYINENGAFYDDGEGNQIPIGYARFA